MGGLWRWRVLVVLICLAMAPLAMAGEPMVKESSPDAAAMKVSEPEKNEIWDFNDFVLRNGLRNSQRKFEAGGSARVVFMGGSVTTRQWREPVMEYLRRRFPQTQFDFIMAGIGGTDATLGAFRLPTDVFGRGPVDLFVLEFAVNGGGVRAMEGIVRQAKRLSPQIDTMILYFANTSHVADARARRIPAIVAEHEQVADHYMLPSLHLYKDVADRLDAGMAVWEDWFTDSVHPGQAGCDVCSDDLVHFFDTVWKPGGGGNKGEDAAADMVVSVDTVKPLDSHCYERGHFVAPMEASDLVRAQWNEGWTAEKTCNYEGPVDVLEAVEPGAQITFDFEGTAVGAYLIVGFDAGMI
ncbi:MAG: hypothetical protein Q4C47_10000, partial [Planctomycetia bacterium]|nr:hypothetical protein [Planctomycetia bacterium]